MFCVAFNYKRNLLMSSMCAFFDAVLMRGRRVNVCVYLRGDERLKASISLIKAFIGNYCV